MVKKVLIKMILLLFLCLILMVFCSSFPINTDKNSSVYSEHMVYISKDLPIAPELIAYIEDFAASSAAALGCPEKTEFTVVEVYTLKKFTSSDTYTLFLFEDGEHAVYDNASGVVEELCVDDSGLVGMLDSRKEYYYAGPGNFVVKENEALYELRSHTQLTHSDVVIASRNESRVNRVRESEKTDLQLDSANIAQKTEKLIDNSPYFFGLLSSDQFCDKTRGTGIHTATAIFLGYYDYYEYDGLINSKYHYKENGERKPGTTCSYISEIQSIVGENESSFPSIFSAIKEYLDYLEYLDLLPKEENRNVCYAANSAQYIFNLVMEVMDKEQPVVLEMRVSADESMNRYVVAYGYKEITAQSGVTKMYYVQTGSENPLRSTYSHAWFGACMYIDISLE